jgi:hypothetical protein
MKLAVRIAVALLLVAAVAAHGHHHHHHRRLMQGNKGGNGKCNGAAASNRKFDFPKGTARAFLDKMDQAQLQKILEKANFSDKSALARELENDPDLVRDDEQWLQAT